MRIPFAKSSLAYTALLIVLGIFAFSFWLDLRLMQEETRALQTERDFLVPHDTISKKP